MNEDEEKREYEKDSSVSGNTTDVEKETNAPKESSIIATTPDGFAKPVDAQAVEPEYEYITGIKLFLAIASVTLVAFLMMLDMTIVVTAIPRITSDFHSLPDVGWYGSVYLISACGLQPLTGKLYSRLSSKYCFLAFLGIFEFGSVLCGAAVNSKMLIIGRTVAGLGSSGITNGALTIISASAPLHKRPALMGVMMSIGQIGILIGPVVGGSLTEYVSWRWCFYINLPIGAVAALFLVLIKIPDRLLTKPKDASKSTFRTVLSSLDLVGFSFFAPFAVMFMLALEWGGVQYPWNSAKIIGLFCGAAGVLILFLAWEYRVGEGAMVPFSMMRKRVVWSSCMVILFFFGNLILTSYYLPIYFQAVKGVKPALSGVYILPGILSQMLFAIIAGVLVGKIGYYLPWSLFSAVAIAIGSGLISTFKPNTSTARWVCYQILAGIGRGCGLQMPIIAIQTVLPTNQIPVGMSVVVFAQTFGGALFLTFGQTIFNRGLAQGLVKHAPNVDVQSVVKAGATAFRDVVKPGDLAGVLLSFNEAINHIFYLGAGAAVAMFAFAWGMGWYSIKKKKEEVPAVETARD